MWGEGPLTARVLVVLEAPGGQEEREGRPAIGATGQRVNALLRANGLTREQVRVENVFQCKEKATSAAGRKAATHCGPSLHGIIAQMPNLEVIFAFGDIALAEVSGYRARTAERLALERAHAKRVRDHATATRRYEKAASAWPAKLAKYQARLANWHEKKAKAEAKGKAIKSKEPAYPKGEPVMPGPPPAPPELPVQEGWDSVTTMRGSCLRIDVSRGMAHPPRDPLGGFQGEGADMPPRPIWLFPLIHPARTMSRRAPRLWPLTVIDFRKACRVWRGEQAIPSIKRTVCRTATELVWWFEHKIRPDASNAPLDMSFDIEWSREQDQLVCLAIGGPNDEYALVPFCTREGWHMDANQRGDIMACLQLYMSDTRLSWGGHYVTGYDERKMAELGVRLVCKWDTLYGFHLCFCEFGSPKDDSTTEEDTAWTQSTGYDLGFVGSVLTPFSYHKGVVTYEKDALAADTEELWQYCVKDVAMAYHSWQAIKREMAANFQPPERGEALLWRKMQVARRAAIMSLTGIPVQGAIVQSRLAHWQEQAAVLRAQAASVVGDPSFNVGSSLQLAKALEAMGVHGIEWNLETGKPRLNGNRIEALIARYPNNPLLALVGKVRDADKECVAYKALSPQGDGYAHTSWKPHGTAGSRWSATPNMQNLTESQREVVQ